VILSQEPLRDRLDQICHVPSLTTWGVCSGHFEVDVHPVGVADPVADGAQAVDCLTTLFLGEGAQCARDDRGGGDHVDRGAGREHAGAAHAVGAFVGQPLGDRPHAGHQVGRRLITSPVALGMAPWLPGPARVIRKEWASDMAMPFRNATTPGGESATSRGNPPAGPRS